MKNIISLVICLLIPMTGFSQTKENNVVQSVTHIGFGPSKKEIKFHAGPLYMTIALRANTNYCKVVSAFKDNH